MEHKYRSFPPDIPVKMSKFFEYQYLAEIYRKYDCNFFREIVPYFSEIFVSSKLELFKFIYIPIENPHKVPGITIGIPFKPEAEFKNLHFCEISHEVTFIKIAYQTHIIFEYLMRLNLKNASIHRMKFQDKFWMLSESVLKNLYFGDVVYRKDSRSQNGIIILIEGQFKCFNQEKKPIKTIGKGYLIDLEGKLKKVKYDDKTYSDKFNPDETMLGSTTREAYELAKEQKQDQEISAVCSNCNAATVLFISVTIIKKYCPSFQDKTCKNSPVNQSIHKERSIMKPEFRSQLQSLKKSQRIKTEAETFADYSINRSRKTIENGIDFPNQTKKFNLMSCRSTSSMCTPLPIIPMDEISNNQVLKFYTKDKELYKKMLKQMSQRGMGHRKILSSDEREFSLNRKQQLMPFFKQELKEDKEKDILKRRKTRQLWGHGSTEKDNFLVNVKKIAEELEREKEKENELDKYLNKKNKLKKKVGKTEIAAFQLLKRNMLNKQYHRTNFMQMNS